jgi:hypothetical protein
MPYESSWDAAERPARPEPTIIAPDLSISIVETGTLAGFDDECLRKLL